nr:coproporphyrinogen III oxidase family protein [Myxococcota bacterium]
LERSGTLAQVESWEETLTPEDRVREALMLGLRTRDGVDLDAVRARTGLDASASRQPAIERRLARGELERDGARLRVPRTSWLALDAIVTDLF